MIDGCQHYLDVEGSENIDGIIFYYGSSQRMLIWKDNEASSEDEMKKHPYSDERINVALENQIRQSYLELRKDLGLTIDRVIVGEYYGTYNQTSAVIILISGESIGNAEWTETVANITFSKINWTPITVWRDGTFYTLTQAYENEFYSIENLTEIYNLTLA